MMAGNMRIAVVDNHPLYRSGVVCTLEGQPDISIVAQGTCMSDAARIAAECAPDVLVLDVDAAGEGMACLAQLAADGRGMRILMLGASGDGAEVCGALRQGACGYLLKGTSPDELVQAVRSLSRGEGFVSPGLAARILSRSGFSPSPSGMQDRLVHLSSREAQILSILGSGLSNREIGDRLDLSEKTIKHYVTGILQKLKVRNRVEAAVLASDHAPQPPSAQQASLHS